jgi:hypothetical protein
LVEEQERLFYEWLAFFGSKAYSQTIAG